MNLANPLDEVLPNRTQLRVLRALFSVPDGASASVREIARRARVGHPSASSALQSLSDLSIVTLQRVPRADLYRLNRDHVITPALDALFDREREFRAELFDQLRHLVSQELPWASHAVVFGSATQPGQQANDIDLALVVSRADVERTEVLADEIREQVFRRFGVRLDVIVGAASRSGSVPRSSGMWRRVWEEGIALEALV